MVKCLHESGQDTGHTLDCRCGRSLLAPVRRGNGEKWKRYCPVCTYHAEVLHAWGGKNDGLESLNCPPNLKSLRTTLAEFDIEDFEAKTPGIAYREERHWGNLQAARGTFGKGIRPVTFEALALVLETKGLDLSMKGLRENEGNIRCIEDTLYQLSSTVYSSRVVTLATSESMELKSRLQ